MIRVSTSRCAGAHLRPSRIKQVGKNFLADGVTHLHLGHIHIAYIGHVQKDPEQREQHQKQGVVEQ